MLSKSVAAGTGWIRRQRAFPVGRASRGLGWGALAALALLGPVQLPAALAAPAYKSRTLASGLANPRGLLVQGQRVLVSEAGVGGPANPQASNCITSGGNSQICAGSSGAIGEWDSVSQTYSRLITGLPSLAQADGSEGTGIADLALGGPTGLLGVFGLGGDPGQPNVANLSPLFGQLVSVDLGAGMLQPRSNLAAYELANDPDKGGANSNPYAVQAFAGLLYATDAGGNTLLRIDPTPGTPGGNFPILGAFVFPIVPVSPGPAFPMLPDPFPASPVPTGLTVNSLANSLLSGELTGFPFVQGAASVYASTPAGPPQAALGGFSLITDVAAGSDGSLYVLEYSSNFFNPGGNGSVWLVRPDATRTQIITGLTEPTGLAIADGGVIYLTNNSNSPQGELREYRPDVPGPLPLLGGLAAWSRSRRLRQRLRQHRREVAAATAAARFGA